MSNHIEIEESFILKDEDNIYNEIKRNYFNFNKKIIEEDTYFTDKDENFIKDRICLRTRKTDEKLLELTFKPKTDNLTEKYGKKEVNISLKIEDYDDMKFILASLGYKEYVKFKKIRKIYSKENENLEYNVMIDEIVGIGKFIELEIVAEEDISEEERRIKLDDFVSSMHCEVMNRKMKPYRDIVKELNLKSER